MGAEEELGPSSSSELHGGLRAADLSSRVLRWEGLRNVRDLGGLPLEDGGSTRFGVIVRADNLDRLSARGWASLQTHGIRAVVDLRRPEESRDPLLEEPPVATVRLPLYGPTDRDLREEIARQEARALTRHDHLLWLYSTLLERKASYVALAVEAVAGCDGGVVIHCVAGKDRTGVLSALLLRAAGVPIEAVAEDYAASESEYGDTQSTPRLGERPRDTIRTVIEGLESRHRDVGSYLQSAGLSPGALARLRLRLRGSLG